MPRACADAMKASISSCRRLMLLTAIGPPLPCNWLSA
jgi:hypothetical protein